MAWPRWTCSCVTIVELPTGIVSADVLVHNMDSFEENTRIAARRLLPVGLSSVRTLSIVTEVHSGQRWDLCRCPIANLAKLCAVFYFRISAK